jgi:hypothetical protein
MNFCLDIQLEAFIELNFLTFSYQETIFKYPDTWAIEISPIILD